MTPESVIALATPIAVIVAAVIQKLDAMKARRGIKAVKATLEATAVVAEKVHILVNSSMTAQLKVSAVALRRVADYSKHPEDVEAWQMAEKLLKDHEARQRVVDGKAAENQRHD